MKKDESFYDYVLNDLFHDIPGITSKSMFSGWGFYKDRVFFALIANGELYFKVDDENQADYEKHGSYPFTYSKKDKKEIMLSYWLLPAEIMDDKERLYDYIESSVNASKRSKK